MKLRSAIKPVLVVLAVLLLVWWVIPFLWGAQPEIHEPPTLTITTLSRQANAFAADCLKEQAALAQAPENFVFSPQSIFQNLAISYLASGGATRQELASALHFPAENRPLAEDLRSLRLQLTNTNRGWFRTAELAMANTAWFDNVSVRFRQEFFNEIEEYFGASFFAKSFKDKQLSAQEINKNVAEQTGGRITGLARPEDFASYSSPDRIDKPALVLANALCFKAEWLNCFDKARTKCRSFRTAETPTSEVQALMMNQHSFLPCAEDDDFWFLELAYRDQQFSLYILLPKEVLSVKKMVSLFSPQRVFALKSSARVHQIDLLLPKFTMESKTDVRDMLGRLGVQTAFDSEHADFKRMFIPKAQDDHLYLRDIRHGVWIALDEEGTEAKAETVGLFGARTSAMSPRFYVDHPFMFLLVHNPSANILFAGWISHPEKLIR